MKTNWYIESRECFELKVLHDRKYRDASKLSATIESDYILILLRVIRFHNWSIHTLPASIKPKFGVMSVCGIENCVWIVRCLLFLLLSIVLVFVVMLLHLRPITFKNKWNNDIIIEIEIELSMHENAINKTNK